MSRVKLAFSQTFSSVRSHRNYRLFFLGQLVSVAGSWMQNVALAWLVLTLTHSPLCVGLLIAARYAPYTFFGLFGGVIADRADNRHLVMGAQAFQMLAAVGLAALTLTGTIAVWEIFLLAAAGGAAMIIDTPARQALTYQMVGRKQLANAIALNTSLFNIGRVGGPAIAGGLLATAGPGWCFVVNAASFLAVLVGLALMDTKKLYQLSRRAVPPILSGLREGFRFVFESPYIITLTALVTVFSVLCFNFETLLPNLASVTLQAGPKTYGIISAALGAGALTGALVTAALSRASVKMTLVGVAGFAICQMVLAQSHSLFLITGLLFLTGLFFTTYSTSANTLIQLSSPDHIRGRVLGIYNWGWLGLAPLGGVLTGWLCQLGGTSLAFYVAGSAALLLASGASIYLGLGYLKPASAATEKPALVSRPSHTPAFASD